ncbi:putative RNA-directed DNA polymerase, eukaryota, reverse transcriptase zinc-binding domain protein [Tanacetum coccineum]
MPRILIPLRPILGVLQVNSYVNITKNYPYVAKNSLNGSGNASNYDHKDRGISNPIITLSQDTSNDFPLALLGCYKDFRSIANTRIMCRNEGFMEVKFKYLGGLWVLFDFPSKEVKEKFLNHNGIKSWFSTLKPWYDEFVVDERLIWLEIEGVPIRAWCNDTFTHLCRKWGEVLFLDDSDPYNRELCSWMPSFISNDSDSDDDANSVGFYEQHEDKLSENNEVESVADMKDIGIRVFTQELGKANMAQEPASSRPDVHDDLKESLVDSDPFGLAALINKTPKKATSLSHSNTPKHPPGFSPFKNVQYESESIHNFSSDESSKKPGFSLLERLEETIKVGLALGLNIEGCEKTLASLIAKKGDLGVTKGIVFLLMFKDSKTSQVDLWMLRQYVVVDGFWKPDDINIKWINVYAPQSVLSKVVLWSSLSNLVSSWDGALVMMEDFNEVREAGERYGSVFNHCQAAFFNEFINDTSLIDIQLGDSESQKAIKEWVGLEKARSYALKKNHQTIPSFIDAKIDQGCASEDDFKARPDFLNILGNQDRMEAKDLAQKDKIKWALEGDENTSFFHGSLKKKRHQLAIKGILMNGEWIEEPGRVKGEFISHFTKRFQQLPGAPPSLGSDLLHRLSPYQSDHLERPITREEIKRSVWDCGGDRASSPDGFTFKFFTTFWNLIEEDVYRFVYEFFHTNRFPKGCNSSFIALIPKISCAKFVSDFRPISLIGCQHKIIGKILANRLSILIESCVSPAQSAFIKGRNILDGPLILSEVLAWYRKRKKGLVVFKVDFEKAFDSLRWDFLDLTLEKFGFGLKWRSWIKDEFELFRGLRQGDPMSPFLFILAMKGLHALMCKAKTIGLFKGVSIGNNNLCISYLMYANDVIIFGDWSSVNAHNLISILRCFYLISGLKINVQKSNVFGVGVTDAEVSHMAHIIGCGAAKFPFKYLGILVGCCNMDQRAAHWHWDSWHWALGSPMGFSAASVRLLIDSRTLDTDNVATRWNRSIPIKVNMFLWRLKLNKLPSRVNLDRRGIEVDSILCPSCLEDIESLSSTVGWLKTYGLSLLNGGTWISQFVDVLQNGMIGLMLFVFRPRFGSYLKAWGELSCGQYGTIGIN